MPPKPVKKKGADEAKPVDQTVELKSLQDVTELLQAAKRVRNYFQLERDKVHKFWDVSRKELANLQHELLNVDEELERMEANHEVEKKVYKQKVRHLNYEHRMQTQEIRQRSDKAIEELTLRHQQAMLKLAKDKQMLHSDYDHAMEKHEDKVKDMRDEHDVSVNKVYKASYSSKLAQTRAKYDEKIAVLRNELELRRRAEIHEIEEKTNEHINELIRKHDEAFREMKTYFNQITSNNLELIRSLKEEIANMKRNDAHNETLMFDIEKENENLNVPLEEVKRDVADLQQELHNYEKDKLSLRNTRSRLKVLDAEYHQLQRDHEALKQKYSEVQKDRDGLVGKFETALRDTMDVVNDKNVELQHLLSETHGTLEERDAQLMAVLQAVNLEPAALDGISARMEDTLEAKNRAIKDLHFELRKIEGQHRQVIAEYERRCRKASVPVLDLATIAV